MASPGVHVQSVSSHGSYFGGCAATGLVFVSKCCFFFICACANHTRASLSVWAAFVMRSQSPVATVAPLLVRIHLEPCFAQRHSSLAPGKGLARSIGLSEAWCCAELIDKVPAAERKTQGHLVQAADTVCTSLAAATGLGWWCSAAAPKQAASAAQRLAAHRARRAGWSVATAHRPPYMFVDQQAGVFTGLLVELLPLLFMAAGLNTTASSFTYYAAPSNSGGSLVNGTWTGGRPCLALSRTLLLDEL